MQENYRSATGDDKEKKYQKVLPMVQNLISGETNFIANLANIVALLKEEMNFFLG